MGNKDNFRCLTQKPVAAGSSSAGYGVCCMFLFLWSSWLFSRAIPFIHYYYFANLQALARLPLMEMACKLSEKPTSEPKTNSVHTIMVSLKRLKQGQRGSSERDVARAFAPFFPKVKEEGWWLVAGDLKTNDLMAMKRVNVCTSTRTTIDIPAR